MRDPNTQLAINKISETTMAFGDVPASFDTLVDLGTTYVYTHARVISTLNTNVTLRFGGLNEVTIYTSTTTELNFKFNDEVEIEYVTEPGSGLIQFLAS